jgi:hypothetical protein
MRFNSNAFILSTAALLSLITPVVNADEYKATITSPAGGVEWNVYQLYQITWYVVKREDPSAVWHHRSLTARITAGMSPTTRAWKVLSVT